MNLGLTALDHEALVQQMMGHSDPRYTRIYFKPAQEDVNAAWRQANRGGAVSAETAG
jgi:hypothetical protein